MAQLTATMPAPEGRLWRSIEGALSLLLQELPGRWAARPCPGEPRLLEIVGPSGFVWPIEAAPAPGQSSSRTCQTLRQILLGLSGQHTLPPPPETAGGLPRAGRGAERRNVAARAAAGRARVRTNDAPQERRRCERRALAVDVHILSADDRRIAAGQLLDLSVSDAQLDLGVPLATGSRVRLALSVPDGEPPLAVWARVEWRDGLVFGVRFVDLVPQQQQRLERVLQWVGTLG